MRHEPPYSPKDYYPKPDKGQSPFSDDWISHNPWMGRVIDEEEKPPNPDLLLAICFNFRNGVPIPAIQKVQERREKAKNPNRTKDGEMQENMLNDDYPMAYGQNIGNRTMQKVKYCNPP